MYDFIEDLSKLLPKETIIFSSGPATLANPSYIDQLNKVPKDENNHTIKIGNQRLHMTGDFNDFRMYMLALHDRFSIVSGSIKTLDESHFSAKIRFSNTNIEQEIKFKSPLTLKNVKLGITSFSECWNDSFSFTHNENTQNVVCDLGFLTQYGELLEPIKLDVQYIGIAKSEGRQAQDRLSEGHEKLQKILAQLSNKPAKQCTIILYRFSEKLETKIVNFQTTLEIIEATLIKYFQPPMNSQRKNFPLDSKSLMTKIKKHKINKLITLLGEPKNCIILSNVENNSNKINDNNYSFIKKYFELVYESENILFNPKHIIDIQMK